MDTTAFICPACKKKLGVSVKDAGRKGTCPGCGAKVVVPHRQAPGPTDQQVPSVSESQPNGWDDAGSEKRIRPALLFCFFLGAFGAHRFYAGKMVTGVIQLFTVGGLGIWVLIDLTMIIMGAFEDKQGNRITEWA